MLLASFFYDTGGPDWVTPHNHWITDDPCGIPTGSRWEGVFCDASGLVTRLELRGAGMKGALPTALMDFTTLERLDFSDNELTYPTTSEELKAYETATARCRTGGITCVGLPPLSCSAFAGNYFLSIEDPSKCELCDAVQTF